MLLLVALFSINSFQNVQTTQLDTNFINLTVDFFNNIRNSVHKRSTDFETRLAANANDYFDQLFKQLEVWLVDNGFDPLKLPDVEKGFEYVSKTITL